jgi:hypothetical protein
MGAVGVKANPDYSKMFFDEIYPGEYARQLKKTESTQVIKADGKWHTLKFDGENYLNPTGSRSIYCGGMKLNFKNKNPKYIKIRFVRLTSDGKKDSTATNTWVLGKNTPRIWYGSLCWNLNGKDKVIMQVKIGKMKNKPGFNSNYRQLKVWQP